MNINGEESVLKMERIKFNYKKELKNLFSQSAKVYGSMGLEEDEKEERKGANNDYEEYEGHSKKMKRRMK